MTAILPSLFVVRRRGIDRGVTESGTKCSAKHTVQAIGMQAMRHWFSLHMTITTLVRNTTKMPPTKNGWA